LHRTRQGSPHYEEFMLRRCLAADPDCRWCPAPDCGYAVIAYGCASCPKLTCERDGCQTEFCYHCKQIWHPNQTCDMARQQRAQTLRVRTKHTSGLSYGQESGPADDIKPCPRCSAYIIKMNDGSCNHMTCAVCGCEFCWLCMKEISDLHYLSPSGCTFWGKKPWSRKKKILWQLGTLIGAPVGISLIAGIAIPAMVIGIPVYVGRKIHSRYEGKKTSKHKRNLAITGGVTLSVIASPVIAAVSVGIGVPIMLAYVYGVVPISLCRGGGCGVSTANGKGVKIEFDEDDGPITVADAWRALKNPSIGESSIEGLTSVLSTSGSPTDGLSVMQGNYSETASFAALSGGTLSGGVLSGSKGKYSRLEVQADVQKEIFPKDSVSLGAISDNASTRAMAGSIISSYNPQDRGSILLLAQEEGWGQFGSSLCVWCGGWGGGICSPAPSGVVLVFCPVPIPLPEFPWKLPEATTHTHLNLPTSPAANASNQPSAIKFGFFPHSSPPLACTQPCCTGRGRRETSLLFPNFWEHSRGQRQLENLSALERTSWIQVQRQPESLFQESLRMVADIQTHVHIYTLTHLTEFEPIN
uniref:RBR-type E3 ubiquitin transferase n=1 Tax=Malurus cyaneus samueli TaxID=2593467 RepID=A0A8C5TPW2_9PASS